MHVERRPCCRRRACVPRATKTCPARYIRAAKDRVESGVRIRRADWCVMGARDNESERSAPFAQFQLMCTRLGPTSSGFPERHPKDVQPEYQLIFGSIRPSPQADPAQSQGGQALTPLTSSAARITPADRVFTSVKRLPRAREPLPPMRGPGYQLRRSAPQHPKASTSAMTRSASKFK